MRSRLFLPALLVAALVSSARAADDPGIHGVGVAQITHDPDTMRLHIELRTQAKDLKEAIAALKTRRDEIKQKLIKLGAVEKSIVIDAVRTPDPIAEVQRQAYSSMRRGKPAIPANPSTVTFSVNVRADWALTGADADAKLLLANDIQKKIRDAKVFDSFKTEEEEERAAIDSMDMQQMGVKPGEVVFYYIARFATEEIAKASADAMAKARADAQITAAAAGVTLAAPLTIRRTITDGTLSPYEYSYSPYGPIQRAPNFVDKDSPNPEALTNGWGPINYTISINASFSFAAK